MYRTEGNVKTAKERRDSGTKFYNIFDTLHRYVYVVVVVYTCERKRNKTKRNKWPSRMQNTKVQNKSKKGMREIERRVCK